MGPGACTILGALFKKMNMKQHFLANFTKAHDCELPPRAALEGPQAIAEGWGSKAEA